MGKIIYLSYATADSKKYKIHLISETLEKYPEIEEVLFWEEDMNDDIIDYMNKNIQRCDIFILFCSKNALNSETVGLEWKAALKIGKKIIPVFINEIEIPPLISPKLGVNFRETDIYRTINEIHNMIGKKLKIQKIKEQFKIAEEQKKDKDRLKILLFGNSDTYITLHKLLDLLNDCDFIARIGDYNRPSKAFYEVRPDFKGNKKFYLRNQLEFNPNTTTKKEINRIMDIIKKKLGIAFDRTIETEYMDRDISIILDREDDN